MAQSRGATFLVSTCEPSAGQREPSVFILSPPERRGDVRVPVHEAIHRRGHLPASPWLLPAPPEQLLRLLGAVLAPGCMGTGSQPIGHLQRGFSADEQQLPSSAQVPRLRPDVLIPVLSIASPVPPRAHQPMVTVLTPLIIFRPLFQGNSLFIGV